jgi:hypothetical protein
MNIHDFIFGPMQAMEKTAYSWWSSKRKEYNIKFLLCLFSAQVLFALVAISSTSNTDVDFLRRITGMLMADLLIILLINLIYFLWPTLEIIFFKKINILYRKYCFAFLNIINVLILLSALIIVFISN